ncbi:MAG TPA: hypothetical protein ENI13_00720 [candidate division CPR3 bacterium]|uniref:Cohesin domain-containing protein n=1 Tax=candidate division CPR3 bacterium TaxID=2268181 RepID=A0A7C1NSC4_UNCC3|nr:hypothetical protein [candidate division CPR3 bacterium]
MAQKNIIIEKTYFLRAAILFVFVFLFLIPGVVQAAALYISPSSGSHSVGSTFSINVYVSSNDQAMNAASGVLSFPQDKLEMTSISKSASIMSLWVEDPSFSNILGTATFEGIVLNPGFTGAAGKIVSVSFRVKAAGSASIAFSTGSVLANDGLGTNILTSLSNAQFTLVASTTPTPTPTPQQTTRVGVPSLPQITSLTHPDQEKWYQSNEAKFSWNLPAGVNGVRLLVGEFAQSIPTIVYIPSIDSRDLSGLNLEDGVWYFHVQLRNLNGWGGVAHYKFQIDSTRPEYFNLSEEEREDATDPNAVFLVKSADSTSGIDYYEFQIDDTEAEIWRDDGSNLYKTSPLAPGSHLLIAKATDKAGNYLVDSAEFIVEAIKAPTLIDYPRVVETGEYFLVKGTSYSDSEVTIFFQRENEKVQNKTAISDENGIFAVNFEKGLTQSGAYKMWAEVTDWRGAKSLPTEKISFAVERSSAFIKLGSWATKVLSIVIPIIALVLLLIGILWYAWYRFTIWRGRIRKEVKEAEKALHKSIAILKKDLAEQIRMLKHAKSKRKLTKEEEKIIRRLKKKLDIIEKFVKKEIQDIKREVD